MHRGPAALMVMTLAVVTCGILPVSASTSLVTLDESTLSYGKAETIRLGDEEPAPKATPQIKLLESSEDRVALEFDLQALESQSIEIEGVTYHALEVEGGGFIGEEGEPMLPSFTRLIQIPDNASVTVRYKTFETMSLAQYRPMPVQADGGTTFVIDPEAYNATGSTPEPVIVGEPAVARDLRVVPITFHPVTYDAHTGGINVIRRMHVDISIEGTDTRNNPTRTRRVIPESFDKLYRGMVPNYTGPRDGQVIDKGAYVIICPNNSTVVNYLQPLVEWHTRRGYDVTLATTSETGTSTSSIKNWIQNAYDNWENPPAFVCLVGDHDGSISLPTWFENYSYYGGEGDQPYTELEGNDPLCDVHLGRISVGSTTEVARYVDKVLGYEATPYMGNTDWYGRGSVLGDPSVSGWTCVQIGQWLKERMLAHGYAEVDTIFTSPYVTLFRNSLNNGASAFSYRGYYGMSGIDEGDIYGLTNGRKLCYATISTCGTGSFSSGTGSACRSEAFIRAGSGTNDPDGGIGAVGTATTGTNTRYNNCLTYGLWRPIVMDDNFSLGASITSGKYEMYLNYFTWDTNRCRYFIHWNSLMGDPAVEIWTGVPQPLTVNYDAQLALGSNSVQVEVLDGGVPLAGAYVCIWKGEEVHTGGYTDGNGRIEIPFAAASGGEMLVTVTAHNFIPHLGSLSIGQQSRFVAQHSYVIDDDGSGGSSGNGNGVLNPSETIELPVEVKNFGSQTVTGLTGTLTCNDPYVTIIDGNESFPDLAPGATGWSQEDFDIQIAPGTPHGHVIMLGLDVASGTSSWHSVIEIPVVAPSFSYYGETLYGLGTQVDPGESGQISVVIYNAGGETASGITGTLSARSQWLSVTDPNGAWSNIGPGSQGENTNNTFGISAAPECYHGHVANMELVLTFNGGARDTLFFAIPVGTRSSDDPSGPDGYGYYAFDNTDTDYEHAPTYDWVEISPNFGGPGTAVGLGDYGNQGDDTMTLDLPFEFQYYGETFNRLSICSNGWIAMGYTYITNYRNWNIPSAGAPAYMIAPWWDNLCQSGSDKVYHHHDAAGHRYIIEWDNVRSVLDTNPSSYRQKFQIILYDPAHHETDTGDGMILFQYNTVNNVDNQQQYATAGIMNGENTDGVLYEYFDHPGPGAAPVVAGRAVLFMPLADLPSGTLNGVVYNASDGNAPLENATITVLESGVQMTSGPDGTFGTDLEPGYYHVVADHVSFEADTLYPIVITEDEITNIPYFLHDDMAPIFTETTVYANTMDTSGPYEIYSTVTEYSSFGDLSLHYNAHGSGWTTVPMSLVEGSLYKADIPGQPYTSYVAYYLTAADAAGNASKDPHGAPYQRYDFWVMPPIFEDDMEAGVGTWSHMVVTDGFVDQWHQSATRNHTLGGSTSWKFGDAGSGDYANLSDGALVSEAFAVGGTATISFWHWMEAEQSGTYPNEAYDGGLIEMSINQGSWNRVTPVGGYTHSIRHGSSDPGPFPVGTPVYSGAFGWTEGQIVLEGVEGSVRLRFRFGSDGGTAAEGWYIDDVSVISDSPSPSGNDDLELIPTRLALHQCTPNPFGARDSGTSIRFDLPQSTPAKLQIFDTNGRLVRTLIDGGLPAGQHSVRWDGRDAHDFQVGSGIYFYKLEANGTLHSRQLLVLR